MCAHQINFNQGRASTTSFRLPKIDIDEKIDVKEKKSFLENVKAFFTHSPKVTGDFSGPKSTFDQLDQMVKDSGARIETFQKQFNISIAKSRTEGATSDNMKSAIHWMKAMCLEGDKLSLYEAKLKLTKLVELRDGVLKSLIPLRKRQLELEAKLEQTSDSEQKKSIEKLIAGCKKQISGIDSGTYNQANAAILLREQDIRVYEAKLEYRKMSIEDLNQELRNLHEQAKTLREEGKDFEVNEILRKFVQIQNILLEYTNFEKALANKKFMDGIENMTPKELQDNIETEYENAYSILLTPCKTKKEYSIVRAKAMNCLRRLNAYQSQLKSIDSEAAKDTALKQKDLLKTLQNEPSVSLEELEERLAKLIVGDLPEVPDNDPNVALKERNVAVAELEDWG